MQDAFRSASWMASSSVAPCPLTCKKFTVTCHWPSSLSRGPLTSQKAIPTEVLEAARGAMISPPSVARRPLIRLGSGRNSFEQGTCQAFRAAPNPGIGPRAVRGGGRVSGRRRRCAPDFPARGVGVRPKIGVLPQWATGLNCHRPGEICKGLWRPTRVGGGRSCGAPVGGVGDYAAAAKRAVWGPRGGGHIEHLAPRRGRRRRPPPPGGPPRPGWPASRPRPPRPACVPAGRACPCRSA